MALLYLFSLPQRASEQRPDCKLAQRAGSSRILHPSTSLMVNNREARAAAETIAIPADGARWSASVPTDVEYATKVRRHQDLLHDLLWGL